MSGGQDASSCENDVMFKENVHFYLYSERRKKMRGGGREKLFFSVFIQAVCYMKSLLMILTIILHNQNSNVL